MGSDGERLDAGDGRDLRPAQSKQELEEEKRKIRRFQLMMDMVLAVISQSPRLTVDDTG